MLALLRYDLFRIDQSNVMKCFTKGFYFPPCEQNMSDFIFLFDSEVLNICSSRVAIRISNKIHKKKTKRL